MNRVSRTFRFISCLLLLVAAESWADEEFPGRSLYPDVPVIERAELNKRLEEVLIVDVRSEYEYETLRIKGASHVPLGSEDFGKQIAELRKAQGGKPVVFYCNGHTCEKSYQAVRKARFAKQGNVYAYDAGIFDWAKNYPQQTELLGQQLNSNALISEEQFKAHLLEPNAFTERASRGDGIIIDIRDRFQREGVSLFSGKEKNVSLDNSKLKSYVDAAKRDNKTLYIYDATGHQVKWLQYFLESNGLENYYFMQDGAKGFYDLLRQNTGFKVQVAPAK